MRLPRRIVKNLFYKLKFYNKKVKIAWSSNIGGFSTEFEGCNRIGRDTIFEGKLGYGSYIGEKSDITAIIGKYCSIASHVLTVRGKHPTSKWVSTSPMFFSTACQSNVTYVQENIFDETTPIPIIGNDVWIGTGSMIIAGIHIGDGAVIAAGAVVTTDVEPYTIVGGVPAKLIKKRFTDEQIDFLMGLKWWEKSEKWIRNHIELFSDISRFAINVIEGDDNEGM